MKGVHFMWAVGGGVMVGGGITIEGGVFFLGRFHTITRPQDIWYLYSVHELLLNITFPFMSVLQQISD